ncbi:AMP-binding enzyme [Sulfitobacter sediminilitoris]
MPDPYAGELPMCFVQVQASENVSVEDLMDHARKTIDERPAWPKIIEVIDEIPLTSVGKIFKPSLRCDAAKLVVSNLLRDELELPDAQVQVEAGGPRGLCVTVGLSESDAPSLSRVEQRLQDFLFETRVTVGS